MHCTITAGTQLRTCCLSTWLRGIVIMGPALAIHCAWFLSCLPVLGDDPPAFLTGSQFQRGLTAEISVAWEGIELREAIRQLQTDRRISILLDRRIDPSAILRITAEQTSLPRLLDQAVHPLAAETRQVGYVLYAGPHSATSRLRTFIALRTGELFAEEQGVPEKQRFALSRQRTIAWKDLTRPAEILESVTRQWDVRLAGQDQLPHDLWAAATLPQVNLTEALALILVQFDLGFAWETRPVSGTTTKSGVEIVGIRIEPLPERLWVDERYSPSKGMSLDEAARLWKESFPLIAVEPRGKELLVRGSVEEQEGVEALQRNPKSRNPNQTASGKPNQTAPQKNSAGSKTSKTPPGTESVATKQATSPPAVRDNVTYKRFTLKIKDVPLAALLETLKKNPDARLTIEYDAEELKKSGIDLQQRIALEVKNATLDELLKAALADTSLTYERTDRTVRLLPKAP